MPTPTPPPAQELTVRVTAVGADSIDVSWDGITGRDPKANGDYIAVWQANTTYPYIPWGQQPLWHQLVTNNTPSGSMSLPVNLGPLPYVLGYAVGAGEHGETGPDPDGQFPNMAVCVPVPALGQPGQPIKPGDPCSSTTIGYVESSSTSVNFRYTTPFGTRPDLARHKIALVKGSVYRVDGNAPAKEKSVTGTDDSGIIGFNAEDLLPSGTLAAGALYTAAYLVGSSCMNVAAVCSFYSPAS